ncbi:MAG: dephospho-CoA kinase [Lachnospiraceae bacterium]|nr:dephospho-CoA kinase [Lachnospiraceae bacterium]
MKIIGLTGGIGNGKSFVARVAEKNFPILHINTDEIARTQMQKGGKSFIRVVEEFSPLSDKLLNTDGEINRQELSRLVMADRGLLDRLDEITHPAVIEEIKEIIEKEKASGRYSAVLIETALIYEAGIDSICDEVWYVYAPEGTRRRRLMTERGYTQETIDSFFMNQNPVEFFLSRADRTVPNGFDVTEKDMLEILSGYLMNME